MEYGITVSTAARTVIDLARTISFIEAVVAADSALRARKFRRDRVLRDAGYKVVHFTWRELFESPGVVIDRIRKALAAPAPF